MGREVVTMDSKQKTPGTLRAHVFQFYYASIYPHSLVHTQLLVQVTYGYVNSDASSAIIPIFYYNAIGSGNRHSWTISSGLLWFLALDLIVATNNI
jgi:hypothetical protein